MGGRGWGVMREGGMVGNGGRGGQGRGQGQWSPDGIIRERQAVNVAQTRTSEWVYSPSEVDA